MLGAEETGKGGRGGHQSGKRAIGFKTRKGTGSNGGPQKKEGGSLDAKRGGTLEIPLVNRRMNLDSKKNVGGK